MKFPAIAIKEGILSLYDSDESLHTATRTALKSGWFDGLRIIDSQGQEYLVRSAEFKRHTGRKLFRGVFAPKLIEVTLGLVKGDQLTLDGVRDALSHAIELNGEFWEGTDVLTRLNQADTIDDLTGQMTSVLREGQS